MQDLDESMDTGRPSSHVALEIRIEARFVLWALRCCAHRTSPGGAEITLELTRGFELADASQTLGSFWRFAHALCASLDAPDAWHHPRCECVSDLELRVLEAMTHSALLHAPAAPVRSNVWTPIVGAEHALLMDVLARRWLHALHGVRICYPPPGELVRDGSSQAYGGLPVPPQQH